VQSNNLRRKENSKLSKPALAKAMTLQNHDSFAGIAFAAGVRGGIWAARRFAK